MKSSTTSRWSFNFNIFPIKFPKLKNLRRITNNLPRKRIKVSSIKIKMPRIKKKLSRTRKKFPEKRLKLPHIKIKLPRKTNKSIRKQKKDRQRYSTLANCNVEEVPTPKDDSLIDSRTPSSAQCVKVKKCRKFDQNA